MRERSAASALLILTKALGPSVVFLLCLALSRVVSAAEMDRTQGSPLEVTITQPSEGETLYSSPISLVYILPVTGRVWSSSFHPSQIEVQLELLQGGSVMGSAVTSPSDDGSYVIEVTVNPGAIHEGELNREDQCGTCHHAATLGLNAGPTTLRVTVTDPAGNRAAAERHVKVDSSGMVALPIRVVTVEDPGSGIARIPVVGSAWLYEWRARSARAITRADGQGVLHLEALAEASTVYFLEVSPTVVDGVLYWTSRPVTVTLPPGADSSPLVTIQVQSSRGGITGWLSADLASLDRSWWVYAVNPDSGTSFRTRAGSDGGFAFADLPLAEYIVTPDIEAEEAARYVSLNGRVDLVGSDAVSISLPLSLQEVGQVRGSVADNVGTPLPFAWLSAVDANGAVGVVPGTGAFLLDDLQSGWQTVVATAPGYFSRAQVVKIATGTAEAVGFQLELQPTTQTLPWGQGQIIVPPESRIGVNESQGAKSVPEVSLISGWLWGEGGDVRPLMLTAAGAAIEIVQGRFALEHAAGRAAWLHLMEGQATVSGEAYAEPVLVTGGEMLALTGTARPVPSPAALTIVNVLRGCAQPPIRTIWQPSLSAQVRDRLARLGVNATRALGWCALLGVSVLACLALSRAYRRFGSGQ